MAHGGTTFGLWSGADRPFKPDASSYDYDAPISEGRLADAEIFPDARTVCEIPAARRNHSRTARHQSRHRHRAGRSDAMRAYLRQPAQAIEEATPRTMEKYDQGHGCILYRTTIPAGPAGILEAAAVHDFGFVFLDGERIGVMDRRSGIYKLPLPERKKSVTLDILVEAVGHVNFGLEVHDRKGIQAPV